MVGHRMDQTEIVSAGVGGGEGGRLRVVGHRMDQTEIVSMGVGGRMHLLGQPNGLGSSGPLGLRSLLCLVTSSLTHVLLPDPCAPP